jgi:glycosyltransferase involved in cell wall biosynthesis
MKVLVVHSQLGVLRGGGENFTRNLFGAFAARGHQVSAAFVADRNGKYAIAMPPSIEPIPLPGWWSRELGQPTLIAIGARIPVNGRLRAGWDRVHEGVSWRIVEWHNQRVHKRVTQHFAGRWSEFDAVYVHGNVRLAAEIARHRPTILRLPGPREDLVEAMRAVHAVCANGDALKRTRRVLGDRATELPIGLDNQLFAPGPTDIRAKLGWTSKQVVVGYVGRLTHLRGTDVLATAFRELSEVAPEARLLVVGQGEEEANLRSLLAQQLAEHRVHIEHDVDHDRLPPWYRAMDVMVMPSRYENFSNSVIEAMACGVPVVASDVGGNSALAASGGVWLVEANAPTALSDCFRAAISNRDEMRMRGRRASEWITGRYSWDATANRLEEIIRCHTSVQR